MNTVHPLNSGQEENVLGVFNQHVAAFMTGNLDSILNDFTEQSIVFTPDGVFEGRVKIRQLYQGLLDEFGVINHGDSAGIQVDKLHAQRDTVFITWHAESRRHIFKFGTDTFVIRNGKVHRQSISYSTPVPREM